MKNQWWIIREILPFWPRACLALVLSALTVSSHIGLMATSSYLLARAALQPPLMDLMITIVGVRFFGISRAVFRYFERLASHDVTFRVLSRVRMLVYKGVEPLAPAHLKELRSGDLLSRVVGDVEVQQNLFLRVLAPPLTAVLVLLGYGWFLGWFNLGFTYILAAFFLLAGVGLPFFIRSLGRGIGQMRIQAKAKMHTSVLDSLQGMSEMLAFGQIEAILERVREAQTELSQADRRMARVTGISNALMGMASNLGMLAVLVLGIILVEQGKLSGILLGMLALGVLSSFEAVIPLTVGQHHLEETQVAGSRLKNLITKPTRPKAPSTIGGGCPRAAKSSMDSTNYQRGLNSPLIAQNYGIEFREISFRYSQAEPWALDKVSFKVPQGKRIGIVGQSGAGKSSIVNLLVQFWEPDSGEIHFGGVNTKELRPEDIRANMGVVSQKPHLFHATVKENLLLAKPEATDEEIFKAASRAKIHDFIFSLPQGYDTLIGEEGMKFSGGQQQRLAIARVLLKDAPILIFDEATNGLDPLTEQELKDELISLLVGKTLIMITHNLKLTKDMDEILVLDRGRIVERGKHNELLQREGQYRRLWEDNYRNSYLIH